MRWSSVMTRTGVALGCAVSAGWAAIIGWEIVRSYRSARTWDGVTCCDPLDDISFLFLLVAFPPTMLVATAAVVRRPAASLLAPLIASIHLGLGAIGLLMGPEDRLLGHGWERHFESMSAASAVAAGLLLLVGWVLGQTNKKLRNERLFDSV